MENTKFWNPYLAGIALGLVLLSSFLLMARGLGASGAAHRLGVTAVNIIAPAHVDATPTLASVKVNGAHPLDDWLVFEILGAFLGGLFSAYAAGRLKVGIIKGPNTTNTKRLALAVGGGILMGMAARMSRGCTSGQALSGGALLSVGSWAFMMMIFVGGYTLARLLRRQWL